MGATHLQPSYIAGELAPSVYGRTDFNKYHLGASTCRNFFINYTGSASTRAGFAYVGMCKQGAPNQGGTPTSNPPRDIRFQFNINQGFDLEFGDQYMRVKSNGAYVIETPENVSAITQHDPGVITVNSHGFNTGDWVYANGIGGMTEYNGLTWVVIKIDNNNFYVTDLFGTNFNTTTFPAYTSGGTFARVYTAVSPYAAIDLPYLKFTQSANQMSLTCVNQVTGTEYAPYDLTRASGTNWTFTGTSFASPIAAPTQVSASATSSTTLSTWYGYVVTSVDASGNESVASTAVYVQNNDIAINAGSNSIFWANVSGAAYYKIYAATPVYNTGSLNVIPISAVFGFLGTSFGGQFTDTNITPDFTQSPPLHQNPFARGQVIDVIPTAGGSSYTQATIGYTLGTTAGNGFVGFPIVVNGQFSAFFIQDTGRGFLPGDTIAITGGAISAKGTYTFTINPTNNQTIILDGTTWTFKTSGAIGTQTNLGQAVASTLAGLVADLNASVDANIALATYSLNGLILNITYKVGGAAGNAYTLGVGTYGGTVSGGTLTGGVSSGGATATLTIGAETGTYPGVVSYFQQRRGYADTLNEPDTYFFSKPGSYTNMDESVPINAGDAIIGTPWAQQINGIQWMIPMPNGLVVLTGNGGWLLSGANGGVFTPSDQFAIQQANVGCSALVPPILINSDILYVQSKNSVVRDLTYSFFTNIYTGEDKTILANHLFTGHSILQWAYAEEPFKIIWAVRDDGILLSFTWLKEQDIWAWARHDTDGLVVGVCTVTEPPVDAIYVIVKRYIQGQWVYYSERMDNRLWQTVEDDFSVDAGLSYPMPQPAATLTPAATNGTSNISSTQVAIGGSGYTSPTAFAVDSTGLGAGAVFDVIQVGGIITQVSPVQQGALYTPGATQITITDPTGSGAVIYPIITNYVTFNASASVFANGDAGQVIRVGGGIAVIVSVVSATQVVANIISPITETVPDDPSGMPIPALSGDWTMTAPTTVVTGLNHLEGKTVAILADGGVQASQIVINGAVTLQQPASAITIGLPFLPQLQQMYIDPQVQPNAQSKRKNIYAVSVRTQSARGISVGCNQPDASVQPDGVNVPWTGMTELKERNQLTPMGQPNQPYTGDYYITVEGGWDTRGQVAFEVGYPVGATILSSVAYYNLGDTSA